LLAQISKNILFSVVVENFHSFSKTGVALSAISVLQDLVPNLILTYDLYPFSNNFSLSIISALFILIYN